MVIAKLNDKWVHIVRFAKHVPFSTDMDWFLINMDWDKNNRRREQFKWIPADTKFDAIKELIGE